MSHPRGFCDSSGFCGSPGAANLRWLALNDQQRQRNRFGPGLLTTLSGIKSPRCRMLRSYALAAFVTRFRLIHAIQIGTVLADLALAALAPIVHRGCSLCADHAGPLGVRARIGSRHLTDGGIRSSILDALNPWITAPSAGEPRRHRQPRRPDPRGRGPYHGGHGRGHGHGRHRQPFVGQSRSYCCARGSRWRVRWRQRQCPKWLPRSRRREAEQRCGVWCSLLVPFLSEIVALAPNKR